MLIRDKTTQTIKINDFGRAAVQVCPSEEPELDDQLRAELKQKSLEAKYANIRELIGEYSNYLNEH